MRRERGEGWGPERVEGDPDCSRDGSWRPVDRGCCATRSRHGPGPGATTWWDWGRAERGSHLVDRYGGRRHFQTPPLTSGPPCTPEGFLSPSGPNPLSLVKRRSQWRMGSCRVVETRNRDFYNGLK